MKPSRSSQLSLETFFTKRSSTSASTSTSEPVVLPENTSDEKKSPDSQSSNILEKLHLSVTKNDPPMQPMLKTFPATNGRKFSAHWYKQHEWIEYSEREDAVFCFPCRHFSGNILRKGETLGQRTFIDKGFKKWRDSKALLLQHSQSDRHTSSIRAWTDFKNVCLHKNLSVASQLCTTRSKEIQENRQHIKTLFRATSFLGRQGLPFRGHSESTDSSNRGNFLEILELLSEENDQLKSKMSQRYGHYASHEYQNDLISLMGEKIKKIIISEVKGAKFFSLLVDETKDASKKEQLAIILRYFYEGCIKERAIGVYHMKDLTAESLSKFIIGLLTSYGIDFAFCVGQCYDGASVMSGWANGVQARIKEVAPNAYYIHCYAHRLNLVLVDTLSNISELRDFFSVVQNVYKFISLSNTRYQSFLEFQKELGFKIVFTLERNVATRWFYWYRSISKIIHTYQAIIMVLEVTADSNTEASCEAIGLKAKLKSKTFVLYLHILEQVLGLTYTLSEQLQLKENTLFKASKLVSAVRDRLRNSRSDEEWLKLSEKAERFARTHDVESGTEPPAKRRKTVPFRMRDYFVGCSLAKNVEEENQLSPETEMKRQYFSVIDRISNEFDRRFTDNQNLLNSLEALDPENNKFLNPEKIQNFADVYPQYFDYINLEAQLKTAESYMQTVSTEEEKDMQKVLAAFQELPSAYSELIKMMQIALTLPISTAENERFFSVLKRVKTYLRTTIGDDRLDSLLLMAVEQNMVKTLNLDELVDDFAKLRPRRYPLME